MWYSITPRFVLLFEICFKVEMPRSRRRCSALTVVEYNLNFSILALVLRTSSSRTTVVVQVVLVREIIIMMYYY